MLKFPKRLILIPKGVIKTASGFIFRHNKAKICPSSCNKENKSAVPETPVLSKIKIRLSTAKKSGETAIFVLSTVKYIKTISGDMSAPTAEDIDTLDHPYNTYKIKGLPPGAICSPGYDAIFSVVFPAETDYYYFVSAKDKSTVFSKTYAEHLRAVASLQKE